MAITSARMQIKRGNEVDFDAEKMLVGEWALSTDKRIVRICVAPNVCIRMATYDAFEVDMAKIEKILEECQTIEDAVELINSQVSEKLQATIEYTNQAKQYRDETEQFRNEVESMVDIGIATTEKAGIVKPDGITIRVDEDGTIHADNGTVDYNELENKPSINGMELSGDKSLDELGIASVEALEETNSKVNIIIEKAELNIKNTAKGNNLHLTDSANGKFVDFSLYGKAEQKQYSGKNLLQITATSQTVNGVTFTVNEDKSITVNGTASALAYINVGRFGFKENTRVILNGCPNGGSANNYNLYAYGTSFLGRDVGSGVEIETEHEADIRIMIGSGVTVNNLVFKPMIRLASITDDAYEPYVGSMPSPNPDYPQDITVSGSDGSVEVVSCGKNLCKPNNTHFFYDSNNLIVENTSVHSKVAKVKPNTTVTVSKSKATNRFQIIGCEEYPTVGSACKLISSYSGDLTEAQVTIPSDVNYIFVYYLYSSTTESVLIQVENGTVATPYEPYTETTSTIPTPDGLCGIKVSSGGNYTDENGQQWICDEIVKYADGSGKRIQRINKVVLNGTEQWYSATTSISDRNRYLYNITDGKANGYVICNSLKGTTYTDLFSTSNNNVIALHNTNGTIQCVATDYADVTAWTAFLAENPMTLWYELAEPIITDLSAEEIAEIEKFHTFYPVTNISNDADCGMSIIYLADSKLYIDNKIAELSNAILSVTG